MMVAMGVCGREVSLPDGEQEAENMRKSLGIRYRF
jgi:hypothetical protein